MHKSLKAHINLSIVFSCTLLSIHVYVAEGCTSTENHNPNAEKIHMDDQKTRYNLMDFCRYLT